MKLLFPQARTPALQAVSLNTAGGVTGGDRFHLSASAEPGAHLVVTTQAAERIYRAQPGETGQVRTSLTVGEGGRLDWLPQETILYDHAAVDRRLEAEIRTTGRLLAVEPLVFGRTAMGEMVETGHLSDRWRIFLEGELVFADNLRLEGAVRALLDRPGVANGAAAMASLLLVSPDAERFTERLRGVLGDAGGASLIRPGVLFARLLARDGYALRQRLIPAIEALSGDDIPKTWTL